MEETITGADVLSVAIRSMIKGWKVANPLDIHSQVMEVVGLDDVYRLLNALEECAETATAE